MYDDIVVKIGKVLDLVITSRYLLFDILIAYAVYFKQRVSWCVSWHIKEQNLAPQTVQQ